MSIVIYFLVGLYAVLTGIAGAVKWRQTGIRLQPVLFVFVSFTMLVALFIPNKNIMFIILIAASVLMHILAVAEGLLTNGKLTPSHHLIRFIFHLSLVLLIYKYIV
ncbi:hypothetical protein [Oceanobacillus neutriphilus]|uniref:Uncharacterized protein n=1 Tax=Oceanobacillus neutriphilus TaxID=531815 RepID=A0ABQ2NT58_9BACI|nr:hypothetical protein [Oceanobacillus neutriphilus]GGP09610.1 hypothetical protein GCM10011346_14420 [Oceanobacillus neutriphilus]